MIEHDKNSKEIAENILLETPRWILDVLFPTCEAIIHNQRHLQLVLKEGDVLEQNHKRGTNEV